MDPLTSYFNLNKYNKLRRNSYSSVKFAATLTSYKSAFLGLHFSHLHTINMRTSSFWFRY